MRNRHNSDIQKISINAARQDRYWHWLRRSGPGRKAISYVGRSDSGRRKGYTCLRPEKEGSEPAISTPEPIHTPLFGASWSFASFPKVRLFTRLILIFGAPLLALVQCWVSVVLCKLGVLNGACTCLELVLTVLPYQQPTDVKHS